MELRVYRTFEWQRDPQAEFRIGGPPPPQVLMHSDTLQVRHGDSWRDIPTVEAEKPPHPHRDAPRGSFGERLRRLNTTTFP